MAPTIKWQRWDSSAYNWFGQTASDALPALEAELDAWITTVNGNASNTGRQITKERGYADSTGGSYAGITLSFGANNNTAKGYFFYGCQAQTTSHRIYFGDTFVDDTSSGGYGTISGGYVDSSISFVTSGQEANWVIITGTVDGQEYFTFGPTFNSKTDTAYQDGFAIIKMTDGEWSVMSGDGSTSQGHIHYWDDAGGTGWTNCARTTSNTDKLSAANTYFYGRFCIMAAINGTPAAVNPATDGKRVCYAASPDVFEIPTSSASAYTASRVLISSLGTGENVYLLTSYFYGPTFLVDLRP